VSAPRRYSRPGVFRRRTILQLTSLLDLLLIIVFVQYLEMQRVSGMETDRRRAAESQRDLLLSGSQQRLFEVWEIHLNGNRSVYPDNSILISSSTQKKVIQPKDQQDFLDQLVDAMKYSPKPTSPCYFLLTEGNVRRDAQVQAMNELQAIAADAKLQTAWGDPPVQFRVVDGGYVQDAK
jgi:hypothetical protein